jgi:hypothetical protein
LGISPDHSPQWQKLSDIEVDELSSIRAKAIALQAYPRQAMNIEGEGQMAANRIRVERQAGKLLKEMKNNGNRSLGGRPKKKRIGTLDSFSKPTLGDTVCKQGDLWRPSSKLVRCVA